MGPAELSPDCLSRSFDAVPKMRNPRFLKFDRSRFSLEGSQCL